MKRRTWPAPKTAARLRLEEMLALPDAELRPAMDRLVARLAPARFGSRSHTCRSWMRSLGRGGAARVEAYTDVLQTSIRWDAAATRWFRRAWRRRWGLDDRTPLSRPLSGKALAAARRVLAESYDFDPRRDARTARRWWQAAAEAGDAQSAAMLGEALRDLGGARNQRTAFRWFRKAALQGDGGAQLNLGYALFYGIGCRRNRRQAFTWYRRAVASRDMCAGLAKANIAHMYRRGEGVRRDRRKALRIYRALARRGWLRGRVWVARCYAGYDGYRERPALAIRWLERTAEHDPWARARLRKYQREGRVVAPESLRRNARGTARTRKE